MKSDFKILSGAVHCKLCHKSASQQRLRNVLTSRLSYHTVDVHAGLQQGLDGGVVSVACGQVKGSVLARVAGHEVRVGAHQHTHHLVTKTAKCQPQCTEFAGNWRTGVSV